MFTLMFTAGYVQCSAMQCKQNNVNNNEQLKKVKNCFFTSLINFIMYGYYNFIIKYDKDPFSWWDGHSKKKKYETSKSTKDNITSIMTGTGTNVATRCSIMQDRETFDNRLGQVLFLINSWSIMSANVKQIIWSNR